MQEQKWTQVAIVSADDATTQSQTRQIAAFLQANGIQVAVTSFFSPGSSDAQMTATVMLVKDSHVRPIIYLYGYLTDCRRMLMTARRLGMLRGYAYLLAGVPPTAWYDAGASAAEAAIAAEAFQGALIVEVANSVQPAFVTLAAAARCAAFPHRCGSDLVGVVATVYDAVNVAVIASDSASDATGQARFSSIVSTVIPNGKSGIVALSAQGDRYLNYNLRQIEPNPDLSASQVRDVGFYQMVPVQAYTTVAPLLWPGNTTQPPTDYVPPVCAAGTEYVGGVCVPCASGSYSLGANSTCTLCSPGTAQPNPGSSHCVLCQPGRVQPNAGSVSCNRCAPRHYSSGYGASTCEACPDGTSNAMSDLLEHLSAGNASSSLYQRDQLEKCMCLPGFYRDTDGRRCVECPTGAECCWCGSGVDSIDTSCSPCLSGTELPVPKKGWLLSTGEGFQGQGRPGELDGPRLVQCYVEAACVGGLPGDLASVDAGCAEGYSSLRCGRCQEGWASQDLSGCVACPNRGASEFLVVVMFVVPVLLCFALLEMSARKTHLGSLALFDAFVGVSYLVSRIGLAWPAMLTVVFNVVGLLNFDVKLFRPECSQIGRAFSTPASRLLLALLLPVVFIAILHSVQRGYAAFAGRHLGHGGRARLRMLSEMRSVNGKSVATSASIRFLVIIYPAITVRCLDVFKCVPSGDGRWRVFSMPDLDCGSEEWRSIVWMPVVGVTVYVVGIPLAFGYMLYRNHHRDYLWPLTAEYSDRGYLWVVVELCLVSVLMLCVVVFEDPAFQAGAAMIVLAAYMLSSAYVNPCSNKRENLIQHAIVAGMVSFIAAGVVLEYSSSSGSSGVKVAVDVCCVLVTAVLLGIISVEFWRDIRTATPVKVIWSAARASSRVLWTPRARSNGSTPTADTPHSISSILAFEPKAGRPSPIVIPKTPNN
jgi:hypothetical protein